MAIESLLAYSLSDSFQRLTDSVAEWIPRLIGALLILLIGYIIARVLSSVARRVLTKLKFDEFLAKSPARPFLDKIGDVSVTAVAAGVAFWLIFLVGLGEAAQRLEVDSITNGVNAVWDYLPNVLAAAVIVIAAVIIAGFVRDFLQRVMGGSPLGTIAAMAAPILILTVAGFMALVQLEIAVPIVTGTYYIVLGAIALGSALAFGLGGRDAAKAVLDDALAKSRDN